MELFSRKRIRSLNQVMAHLKVETLLLKTEWPWIVGLGFFQYVHSCFTNLAYYIQTKLSVEQRFPLYDLGHELFGEISDGLSDSSEVLVFGGLFLPYAILMLSIPLWKISGGQPRFIVLIGKRSLLAFSIALGLRICSFIGTSLPGSAEHCRILFNQTCLNGPHISEADCAIENPEFDPTTTVGEVFGRIDAFKGCGDLMFSSHTMYTFTLILIMLKYWYSRYLLAYGIIVQTFIAIIIVAARKHYTVDVFTALYVIPMLWFLLEAYHYDINHKDKGSTVENIWKYYGINLRDHLQEFDTLTIENQIQEAQEIGQEDAPYTRKDSVELIIKEEDKKEVKYA